MDLWWKWRSNPSKSLGRNSPLGAKSETAECVKGRGGGWRGEEAGDKSEKVRSVRGEKMKTGLEREVGAQLFLHLMCPCCFGDDITQEVWSRDNQPESQPRISLRLLHFNMSKHNNRKWIRKLCMIKTRQKREQNSAWSWVNPQGFSSSLCFSPSWELTHCVVHFKTNLLTLMGLC